MKMKSAITLMVGLLFLTLPVAFGQNKGPASIVLKGKSAKDVPVLHHKHQGAVGDCNPCHKLFPQAPGSIEKLKAEGKLKNKELMEECRACHRQMAAKGEKTGPTDCKGCHPK